MKKSLKMLLLVFFLSVIYAYMLAIENIPDKLVIFEGENISLKTLYGLNIESKNMETIETSSTSNSKISGEVGKQTLEVSLFDNIPLKDIEVNVLERAKVIPVRKYSRSEIIYKWSISSWNV